MKKYAIFNPLNGQYTYTESLEECKFEMANTAYNFYISHSHNNPVSIVEYFEDGTEKWQNGDGTNIDITNDLNDVFANNQLNLIEI